MSHVLDESSDYGNIIIELGQVCVCVLKDYVSHPLLGGPELFNSAVLEREIFHA